MSGHPTLTTAVYITIAVVFLAAIVYMILYNRSVKSSKTDFINKGAMAARNDNPSNPGSTSKESSGRGGSTT